MLVILAGQDENKDRSIKQIADWCNIYLKNQQSLLTILPTAKHSLSGFEKKCCKKKLISG